MMAYDYATVILLAMNQLRKPMYEGTVSRADVLKRRAKAKLARKARRANR